MFEKIKGIGTQVATKANDAADGISATVKEGFDSVTNTAINVTEGLNEKAARSSSSQLCTILEIAIAELKTRPLSAHPISLSASVNIGICALEMQINLQPEKENQQKNCPVTE